MYHISSKSTKPVMVNVMVNVMVSGQQTEMELDAGASVTLMSEESFKRIKRNGVTLQESKVKAV